MNITDSRCWCCQNLLTSGDTNGVCRACREKTYNENKYKKMWEVLEKRLDELPGSSHYILNLINAIKKEYEGC